MNFTHLTTAVLVMGEKEVTESNSSQELGERRTAQQEKGKIHCTQL